MISRGDDWSEDHHDTEIQDEQGRRLAKRRLPEGVKGMAEFHAMVAGHVDDPAEVVVGIETRVVAAMFGREGLLTGTRS